MSSSIEEYFQPPEWATKEEVIKAAQHYINYWKIEARQRNGQWLQALDQNARLKAEVERLRPATFFTAVPCEVYEELKAENERLTQEYSDATNHYNKLHNDLQAENERLRKAGDRMAAALNGEYNYELPCVEDWNAAKDGKTAE